MNRYRWCLLLAAISIVLAAQQVFRYHEAEVWQYLDRPDGSGAALLRYRSQDRKEIIAWDAGLKNRRTIHRMRIGNTSHRQIGIASDSNGARIVFPYQQRMMCIDAKTGAEVWESDLVSAVGGVTQVDFINDEQHLLLSSRNRKIAYGSVIVLEADTGKVVAATTVDIVVRFLTSKKRLAVQYGRRHERFGQWDVFELEGGKASLVKSHEFVPREMLRGATQVDLDVTMQPSSSSRLEDDRRLDSKSISTVDFRRATWFSPAGFRGRNSFGGAALRIQSMGYGESMLLLFAVGIAAAIWANFLVGDGLRSDWQWRPAVDALWLTTLLALLCVPLWMSGLNEPPLRLQPAILLRSAPLFFQSFLPSLLSAAGLVAVLAALFWERRPMYLWGAVFICCALPVLLPLVAVCLVAMKAGYRLTRSDESSELRAMASPLGPLDSGTSTSNMRRVRFGISEMLLATAGVAIFIGIGQLGAFLIPVGCLLVGLVVLSLLFATKSVKSTTLFVTVFFVALLGAGHEVQNGTSTAVFLFAVPMFVALAAMHGYRLTKKPVAAAALPADLLT